MGDGTNLVIVLATELLSNAEFLLRMGLHPSEVIDGFDLASKKTLEILEGELGFM
jgi:T-complex protein 1 subunit theta